MDIRTITLHTFCSVKGGVGKSTLAVACASLLAESGHPTLVLDADLTGTSLADGLRLQAPVLALRQDGTLDLATTPEPPRFYSEEESQRLLRRRWEATDGQPRHVPLLNDALAYEAFTDRGPQQGECRIDALLWRHASDNGVRYLPSSATQVDVEDALGWLYRTDYPLIWVRRLTWLLHEALQRLPDLRHIVIDLPPGLVGFAREVLVLLPYLAHQRPLPEGYPPLTAAYRWRVNPFLVSSMDRNDNFAAVQYLVDLRRSLPTLLLLVNRSTTGLDPLRQTVERFAEDDPLLDGLEKAVIAVDEMRSTLGRVFVEGGLTLDSRVRALRQKLRLEA